jgi:hypothetical protein
MTPAESVIRAISRIRAYPVTTEAEIYAMIARELDAEKMHYAREVKLGPRNRIDFIVAGRIGIETKKGKPNSKDVAAQIERYCVSPMIGELILVVERNVFQHVVSASGKPVHYIALNKLWGIAI